MKSENTVTGNGKNMRKMFSSGQEGFVSHGEGEISREVSFPRHLLQLEHTEEIFHPQLV